MRATESLPHRTVCVCVCVDNHDRIQTLRGIYLQKFDITACHGFFEMKNSKITLYQKRITVNRNRVTMKRAMAAPFARFDTRAA